YNGILVSRVDRAGEKPADLTLEYAGPKPAQPVVPEYPRLEDAARVLRLLARLLNALGVLFVVVGVAAMFARSLHVQRTLGGLEVTDLLLAAGGSAGGGALWSAPSS